MRDKYIKNERSFTKKHSGIVRQYFIQAFLWQISKEIVYFYAKIIYDVKYARYIQNDEKERCLTNTNYSLVFQVLLTRKRIEISKYFK